MYSYRQILMTAFCLVITSIDGTAFILAEEIVRAVVSADGTPLKSDNLKVVVPSLSPTQKNAIALIKKAPLPMDSGDPVSLIQAVNGLFELGKPDAIATLREYLRLTPNVIAQQRLCLILPLLFDPSAKGDKLPPGLWYDQTRKQWLGVGGRLEVAVCQGIPFDISGEYTHGGYIAPVNPLVEWAAKDGRFRTELLRPTNDPFSAAAVLHRDLVMSIDELVLYRVGADPQALQKWLRQHVREQALQVADWQNDLGRSNRIEN